MNIAVLLGGNSPEREISLRSGDAIANALIKLGHKVTKIDAILNEIEDTDFGSYDNVFIALHGGDGENGNVQAVLDKKGIPYTGSGPQASLLCLDKILTKQILNANNILTPKQIILNKDNLLNFEFLEKNIPCVLKPRFGGSSIGLNIIKKKNDIFDALKNILEFGNDIIIERYIRGRELTVGILGDRALPIVEIIPKNDFYDFDAKYCNKKTLYVTNPDVFGLDSAIQKTALDAFNYLGCSDFARADFILDNNKNYYFLEMNSIPGFTESSLLPKAAKSAGINFEELCEIILRNKKLEYAAFFKKNT